MPRRCCMRVRACVLLCECECVRACVFESAQRPTRHAATCSTQRATCTRHAATCYSQHICITLRSAGTMQRSPPMDRALRQAWHQQRRLRQRLNKYSQGAGQRQSQDISVSRASTRRTLHVFGQLPSSKISRATRAMRPALRRRCVRVRACTPINVFDLVSSWDCACAHICRVHACTCTCLRTGLLLASYGPGLAGL